MRSLSVIITVCSNARTAAAMPPVPHVAGKGRQLSLGQHSFPRPAGLHDAPSWPHVSFPSTYFWHLFLCNHLDVGAALPDLVVNLRVPPPRQRVLARLHGGRDGHLVHQRKPPVVAVVRAALWARPRQELVAADGRGGCRARWNPDGSPLASSRERACKSITDSSESRMSV